MTFSVNQIAGTESLVIKPSGTSKTAILAGIKGTSYTLIKIRATPTSGTPTLELHFYDKSENKEALIYSATATATPATEIDLSGHTLAENDELRATVSATDVDILLTYAVRGGGSGS